MVQKDKNRNGSGGIKLNTMNTQRNPTIKIEDLNECDDAYKGYCKGESD